MGMTKKVAWWFAILLITTGLSACSEAPKTVRIALNPWPGYEFLFLAQEKGFFKQHNLDVEIVEVASLADGLRAYTMGNIDGMTSTAIELVQAANFTNNTLNVLMVTDYSFGGDKILAKRELTTFTDLKGKTIGLEMDSLGIFVLHLALAKHKMSLSDVKLVNVEQLNGKQALLNNKIDAFVTYPPASTELEPDHNLLFSSKEIPGDIQDLVFISSKILNENPDFKSKFVAAWDDALRFAQQNKAQAYQMMADREGISVEDFSATVEQDLIIADAAQQAQLMGIKLNTNLQKVCNTLDYMGKLQKSCRNILNRIH